MEEIVSGTGWQIRTLIEGGESFKPGGYYVAVLE
jgi:hypothetical protein